MGYAVALSTETAGFPAARFSPKRRSSLSLWVTMWEWTTPETFFVSVTYCLLVRSEGGEDVRNFNNLQRWAKSQVHFPPIGEYPQ
jgi:hypothetical protein